jgi:hypothetical protein
MRGSITGVSIFTSIFILFPLVGGNSVLEQTDEITLLQAGAKSKSSGPVVEEPRTLVCTEPDKDGNVQYSTNPEDVDADPTCRMQLQKERHEAMGKSEPAPILVLSLRVFLMFLSCTFFIHGACKWFPREVEPVPTKINANAKPAADAVVSARQCSELQAAALVGDDARCEALLKESPEVLTFKDSWGTTALHAAATSGTRAAATLFLEHGAPVDPVDAWDETPLHQAAREGHVEVCELLVKHGASLRAVNADDWTPLVVAGQAGQEAVCTKLLELGAGVEGMSEEDLPDMLRELIMAEVMAKVARKAA